ncbi:UdgX family uracil-DNA binding protein [Pelagicoccus sp. SDUM812002]|uniref:UdgX family uracil-DNA binding protein n=1 Tax=Pelagicoccus sp. SDUM812002 TaxID=3041266 RepID=UPI00280F43FA|nr:UdgX family uracil-DNA binding protein [Pelagicoccus sp. SDUM812002]MDQ8184867.1 UdgX family uracil-DNA binding protein [Pelagicoccus sp. SDUM812002]
MGGRIHAEASNFEEWRNVSRELLARAALPEQVVWNEDQEVELNLGVEEKSKPPLPSSGPVRVSDEFVRRAKGVACHVDLDTWGLLYRMLWRMTRGEERQLLRRANDVDVRSFELKEKAVRRERHKMTAFVRFRKVEVTGEETERERFVAWYEPEHDVVYLAAPFFRDRFSSMDWSILTPRTCVHWDGRELSFSEGASFQERPDEDELEKYWLKYYASTFNPSRLNISMMEREMPRRYWKNLPEASLIAELSNGSYGRSEKMKAELEDNPKLQGRRPKGAPDGRERGVIRTSDEIRLRGEGLTLEALRDQAQLCRACPLHERATQVVFGEGPPEAKLMIVGEQPGDREDLAGHPFVGPSGEVLASAIGELGIDREAVYVTNAVKHFKWRPSGKIRLHQSPAPKEVHACKPWLVHELEQVHPRVVLCLGSTAAAAILGRPVSVTRERGLRDDPGLPYAVVVSYHPAYLLRIVDESERLRASQQFYADLEACKQFIDTM